MLTVYDPAYRTYNFGPGHPFSPDRLAMLTELLDALGAWAPPVTPEPATRADVRRVHGEAFVAHVERASDGAAGAGADRFGLGTPDVPAFEGMDEAARWLVGGTLYAAQAVASGRTRRALQLGGGLHHAQRDLAAGFCVYNDLGVAIAHLRDAGLRVAYLDVDVHHGDGVQWLFYDDPAVLTISLHESGRYLYPGTGRIDELGTGAGRGLKLNVPLEPYTSDDSYLRCFERVVPHALAWFGPDVLVVQCGADMHAADPLAHLALSTRGYEAVFRRTLELADEHAHGRAVFTLGGGYDPDATTRVWAILHHVLYDHDLPERLPEPWREAWEERLGRSLTPTLHDPDVPPPTRADVATANEDASRRLMERAASLWM